MIYLIDDKISRQTDYGWDASRFKEYESILIIIQNEKGIKEHFQNIFENDNIIIFHDSFLNSNGLNVLVSHTLVKSVIILIYFS